MDIDLGDGIDGTETAEIILSIKEIPIIFLSNHTEPEIVEKTEKITSYGYVVKDTGITVLDASIKMAFKLFDSKMEVFSKDQAIKESEKRLRMALENASDGVFDWNMKTGDAYYNKNYFDMLGYKRKDFQRSEDAWIGLIHSDDKSHVEASVGEYVTGERSQHRIEYRMKRKDGSYCWVLSRGGLFSGIKITNLNEWLVPM